MKAYTIEAQSAEEEFASAREQFEELVDQLCSEPVLKYFEHGEVETLVEREGREVLRRLVQGYLNLRAAQEPRHESVSGADDGLPRRHCRKRERELMTLFGPVRVRRKGYSAHALASVFPLDEELNLAPDKYSHGLRRRVGEEVVKGAFEGAADAIERGTGGKVPKRQVEQLTYRLSRDFDAYYRQTDDDDDDEAAAAAAGEEHGKDLLVMSVDGKGIVMREQDLREATRKAAKRERHKLKTRLSRGEKLKRQADGHRRNALQHKQRAA